MSCSPSCVLVARSSSVRSFLFLVAVAGCPTPPRRPHPPAAALTAEVTREGGSLRGIAAGEGVVFAAFAIADRTVIEARPEAPTPTWRTELAGSPGPIARAGAVVAVTLGGADEVAGVQMRGRPGAVVVGLDAATGATRWKLGVDSSEWAVISAIAAAGDELLIAGSFTGTLRTGPHVVSSGGKHDGFVARITAGGQARWLVRLGGPGGDAIQGVAARGDRIAIAGTFTAGADLQGEELVPFDDRSLLADIFVAELDGAGRRKWTASFGGKADDAVAGVAIDSTGRIAVAATAQQTIRREGKDLVARGPADGLVAWYGTGGAPGAAYLFGGLGFDGLHAITAVDDRIVVGGFFADSFDLGGRPLRAEGDDAFLATLDGREVVDVVHLGGAGREELVGLVAIPGGVCAGLAHTGGLALAGHKLPAPRAPATGAAIVVRPVR